MTGTYEAVQQPNDAEIATNAVSVTGQPESWDLDRGGCASGSGSGGCARVALDRRRLLRGAAAAGGVVVAGAGLTACGHILDRNENVADGSQPGNATVTSMTAPPATGSAAAKPMSDSQTMDAGKMPAQDPSTAAAKPSGTLLGKAAAIPVGGGMVFADHQVVVTQPKAGTYKAFSSVCTHAGCQCNDVTSGMITCPCHGAAFSITDGSVLQGPAHTPLAARTVTVAGGEVRLQA